MPSITTHHFFAQEVYNNLTNDERNHINKELTIYYTFAQSHDYLFYYTFNPFISKRIKQLGHTAHHQKTQDYIINIIKYIQENNLENNHQAIAYLYGTITHYCLDTTCHPYIFYKTGVWRHNKKTQKYRGEHNHIEKDLDSIYYQKYTNKTYKNCNLNKDIIKKPKFSKNLSKMISTIYYNTYNEKNISKYYLKGIRDAKIINFLFINDYSGLKEKIYKIIDKITNNYFGYLQSYSTHKQTINKDILNLNHREWNHPSFPNLKYNTSFDDLLMISLNKALKIIKEINKVLYDKQDIKQLIDIIPNLDYSTGIEIDKNIRMKYFSY